MSYNDPVTRSVAATTVASELQSTSQKAPVSIAWVFIADPGPPRGPKPSTSTVPLLMEIPNDLFTDKYSLNCKPLFIEAVLNEYGFNALGATMWLWRPKEPLLLQTYCNNLPTKLEDSFQKVSPFHSLSNVLGDNVDNLDYLHLIVTAKEYQPSGLVMDPRSDGLPKFPAHNRFRKAISTPGKSPSWAATSTEYRHVQNNPDVAIYDGRCTQSPPFATIAPPIELFHPVFGKFRHLANDPGTQVTNEDLKNIQEFMHMSSTLYALESARAPEYRRLLTRILQVPVHPEPNDDGTSSDGVYMVDLGEVRVPILITELKRELGDGGCDPSIQAGVFMRRAWIQRNRTGILNKCCCPTLMLAGGGPWLSVLGAVFTDKVIVQKLTDMMWTGHSSTHEDVRVYNIARVLVALRTSLHDLAKYYEVANTFPPFDFQHTHPRFYPYPTSFTENNQAFEFDYVEALEDSSECVTYRARIRGETDSPDIVVKFVARYGKDAHALLAQELDCDTMGHLTMVVMDYITTRSGIPPEDFHQQICNILTGLHIKGYVFGDLRCPNILFDVNGKVKFIDFDWSGRFDMSICDGSLPEGLQEKINSQAEFVGSSNRYVCYPLNLAKNIWVKGVNDLQPIRPQHDWGMLAKLP